MYWNNFIISPTSISRPGISAWEWKWGYFRTLNQDFCHNGLQRRFPLVSFSSLPGSRETVHWKTLWNSPPPCYVVLVPVSSWTLPFQWMWKSVQWTRSINNHCHDNRARSCCYSHCTNITCQNHERTLQWSNTIIECGDYCCNEW